MKYYCEEKELVLKELSASDDGLRQAEAERRLEQDGKTVLPLRRGNPSSGDFWNSLRIR